MHRSPPVKILAIFVGVAFALGQPPAAADPKVSGRTLRGPQSEKVRAGLEEGLRPVAGMEEQDRIRASFPSDPRSTLNRDEILRKTRDGLMDRLRPLIEKLYEEMPGVTYPGGRRIPLDLLWSRVRRMVNGLVSGTRDQYVFWVQEEVIPDDEQLYRDIQTYAVAEGRPLWDLATQLYSFLYSYSELPKKGWPERTVRSIQLAGLPRLVPIGWLERFAEQRGVGVAEAWEHIRRHWEDPEVTWPVPEEEFPGPGAGMEEAERTEIRLRVLEALHEVTEGRELRWQLAGPSVVRRYPGLIALDRYLGHFSLDLGGSDTGLAVETLVGQREKISAATYYGTEEEHTHFDSLARPRGISAGPGPIRVETPSFQSFLQQILANLTLRTEEEFRQHVREKGVNLQHLAADLERLAAA